MRFKLAAVIAACLVFEVHVPPPVEACGVKLTVKQMGPRKAVARTSNPSQVLLVGSPPRRLANDLSVSGHKVEVVQNLSTATRERYAVVIVDNDKQASAARERFGNSVVFVRSGNVGADQRAVEDRVRPAVVAAATTTPVGAKTKVGPTAAGPDRTKPAEIVSAKPAETVAVAEPPAPAPTPTPAPAPTPTPPAPIQPPTRVTTTTAPNTETPRAKPVVADTSNLGEEIFFQLGSKNVAKNRALDRAVKWLTTNSGINVVVEGHADPSGTPDGNMALSEARADAVKIYLVDKGIDATRIEVKPLGDTQLKYGAADGRNRRVAIRATR